MKKIMGVVLVLALLAGWWVALAQEEESEWTYHYEELTETTAKLITYEGNEKDIRPLRAVGGYAVTCLDAGLYQDYEPVESAIIHGLVTDIGARAFLGCKNLRWAYLPPSVQHIGEDAFSGCHKELKIYGVQGSSAQQYAADNGLAFVPIESRLVELYYFGDNVKTLEIAQLMVDWQPESMDGNYFRGSVMALLGNYSLALVDFAYMASEITQGETISDLASVLLDGGRYEEAVAVLKDVEPSFAICRLRAMAYAKLGVFELAQAEIDACRALEPANRAVYDIQGQLDYLKGDFKAAAGDYQFLKDSDDATGYVYFNLAEALYLDGQLESADLAAVYSLAEGGGISNLKGATERYEKAAKEIETAKAVQKTPLTSKLLYEKASADYAAGDHLKALEALNMAVKKGGDENIYYFRAILQPEENMVEKAGDYAMSMVYFNSLSANLGYGETVLELDRYMEAAYIFKQLIQSEPEEPYYHYMYGYSLFCMDRYREAIQAYSKAIELDKDEYWYYVSRGDAYYNMNCYYDALFNYEKALALNPESEVARKSADDALGAMKE